jgi:hypothetical protein
MLEDRSANGTSASIDAVQPAEFRQKTPLTARPTLLQ